jgi:hypothetical protein
MDGKQLGAMCFYQLRSTEANRLHFGRFPVDFEIASAPQVSGRNALPPRSEPRNPTFSETMLNLRG